MREVKFKSGNDVRANEVHNENRQMTPRRTIPNRGNERLGAAARTPLTAADYPDRIVREALAVGKVSVGA